ncbi:MAG: hypothetical protein RLZZ621_2353 [Gemmatimonadota bacterium]
MRRACLLMVGLVLCASCGTEATTPSPWTLVWSDEFDGPSGARPNAANWTAEIGTDWGNQQLEFDTDRPTNASLDGNGHLVITARRESYQDRAYTSARLTSQGKQQFQYGKIEARAQLPRGRGLWPAFWMLGANFPTAGWPASGEIDVMEYRGQEPSIIHGTVHGPGYSGGKGITRAYQPEAVRFDNSFHVFTIEWNTDQITWFVDGVSYHVVRRTDVPGPWVFDRPFHLLLNVAVGGTFLGAPDQYTPFPTAMVVDWVRVYRLAP